MRQNLAIYLKLPPESWDYRQTPLSSHPAFKWIVGFFIYKVFKSVFPKNRGKEKIPCFTIIYAYIHTQRENLVPASQANLCVFEKTQFAAGESDIYLKELLAKSES